MNPILTSFLVGLCIGAACAITVPRQPQSIILTIVLVTLWNLTFLNKPHAAQEPNNEPQKTAEAP